MAASLKKQTFQRRDFPEDSHTVLVVIALIMFMQIPNLAFARYMPTTEKLETIETPHFRIIYQESLVEAAPCLAEYCEEAYSVLTKIFGWEPQGKIDILFMDASDTHNAWATVASHNMIAIHAAGSEPGSSIFQPGNYLRRTVFHELTHAITMDMRYGYNRFLSRVFGKVMPSDDILAFATSLVTSSPVMLSPEWFLEGVAIWSESEFTPPGRGKASIPDMIFRCAVRDDNLLPYSKWHLEIPHWPHGLGAYLYGTKLIQYLCKKSDKENPIGDLTRTVADSFLFNLNSAARKISGKTFETLAAEMLLHETEVQKRNLKLLESIPTTGAPRLTPKEIAVYQPFFLGSKIYFLGSEEERRDTLYVYDVEKKSTEKIQPARVTSSFGNLTASKDGRYVYYTRLDIQEYENFWYEIRRLDTETGEDSLVTDKGRYRAIDLSPEGERIAAVSQRVGNGYLLELELGENGAVSGERVLDRVPLHRDLSTPRYSRDGRRIAYVEADSEGFRLKVFDLKTNSGSTVFGSKSQILSPTWHPRKDLLVFSSDENGVYNLYEIEDGDSKPPVPVSHVTGGLFFPTFSPDGSTIAATGYDGQGPHLTLIRYNPEALAGKQLPRIGSSRIGGKAAETVRKQEEKGDEGETGEEIQEDIPDPENYNSLANIRFNYWSPMFFTSVEGDLEFGAGASFSDPTGYQNLMLLAGQEPKYGSKQGAIHYFYSGLYPVMHLYASVDQGGYPNLLVERGTGERFDHAEEVEKVGAAIQFPLLKLEREIWVAAGYEHQSRTFVEKYEEKYRAKDLSTDPSEEDAGLVWTRLEYLDGAVFGRSNSIEEGRQVSLVSELANRSLGGGISRTRYLAGWSEYVSMPWIKNHVLKLSGTYGFGSGDRAAQGHFGLGGAKSPGAYLSPSIPGTLSLRGYPPNFQTGDRVLKVSLSYRFPIRDFSKGHEGKFPLYSRQFFGEIFSEAGRTWDENGYGDDLGWIHSYGIEVNYALKIFRFLRASPGLGIAYAPDRIRRGPQESDAEIYLSLKGWVNF